MKVLTTLLIAMTFSGCSLFKDNLIEPLCLPSRPVLEDISIDEQRSIERTTLRKLATNDAKLKSHINTIERITGVHNEQFKVNCTGDSE